MSVKARIRIKLFFQNVWTKFFMKLKQIKYIDNNFGHEVWILFIRIRIRVFMSISVSCFNGGSDPDPNPQPLYYWAHAKDFSSADQLRWWIGVFVSPASISLFFFFPPGFYHLNLLFSFFHVYFLFFIKAAFSFF